MTGAYGVDPNHDAADVLAAMLRERYGPLGRLERERFRLVDRREATPDLPPITAEEGDAHLFTLTVELDRHDRESDDGEVA